ncbi:type II secretion system F family protein [Paenibacillus glacialis]|uniref:Pilus assembly protein TadB n=1 Tax=Paenibacillus glacialis TaxID=494026 RepID=A0A168P2Y2_9BACL|nr:type II secretion system F family protein [Paenibacillus glacialis]OAB46334.1 pilus assembly protein TadB [Paenibacillus glacialis]
MNKEKVKTTRINKRGGKGVDGGNQLGPSLPDYSIYELSTVERVTCIVIGGFLFYGIGYLFYHQWIVSLLIACNAWFVPRYWRTHMLNRRRAAMNLHFKQALFSLSSSLSAGRSVENGFREAVQDLRMLDPEAENDLIMELNIICARLEYGEPIEEALQDFSRRAVMEDITNFADVFTTCKRTGGDLVEVVRRTSTIIGEKLDIQQEISVMIAQKKFESKAILVAPILMILFMNLSSPDYMLPMYSGIGFIISTLSLAVLGACTIWISKIMNIKL